MNSMSYCKHENAAAELDRVWDEWYDWDESGSNEYEAKARRRIMRLVREMHEAFDADGDYDSPRTP